MHPYLGIDVGKRRIHVAYPLPDAKPRRWPVVVIDYQTPAWHEQLVALVAPGAVVCFEPTGWHLSAPLVSVLTQLTSAEVWLVGHGTSGRVREVHVSSAKTDDMDARALALIASWVAAGHPPANTRRHNLPLEGEVQRLRALVNDLHRTNRQQTRLKNRLHIFAHAIHPELDLRFTTWLRLAVQGIITPKAIRAHVASGKPASESGQSWRFVVALAANLPEIDPPAYAVESIIHTLQQLTATDAEARRLRRLTAEVCTRPPFAETTRRLLTIPGSGGDPVNIAPFLVATHGLLGAMTPDQAKSAIGISAKTDTSGATNRTRAAKGGYKPAMTQLFMWSTWLLSNKAPPNPIRDYHQRLTERGKAKAFRATRAKLAVVMTMVARDPDGYRYTPPTPPTGAAALPAQETQETTQ